MISAGKRPWSRDLPLHCSRRRSKAFGLLPSQAEVRRTSQGLATPERCSAKLPLTSSQFTALGAALEMNFARGVTAYPWLSDHTSKLHSPGGVRGIHEIPFKELMNREVMPCFVQGLGHFPGRDMPSVTHSRVVTKTLVRSPETSSTLVPKHPGCDGGHQESWPRLESPGRAECCWPG